MEQNNSSFGNFKTFIVKNLMCTRENSVMNVHVVILVFQQ